MDDLQKLEVLLVHFDVFLGKVEVVSRGLHVVEFLAETNITLRGCLEVFGLDDYVNLFLGFQFCHFREIGISFINKYFILSIYHLVLILNLSPAVSDIRVDP